MIMRKSQEFIIKGMNRDLSLSKFSPELAYENMNLRITVLNSNTLLSVTNEKGNTRVSISGDSIEGECIGRCVLGKYLVLFTVSGNVSRIYRLNVSDSESFESLLLYSGDLGFDRSHPIECLGIVETENIQKVYWIDGIHQLRSVNIVADEEHRALWSDISFDSVLPLQLKEECSVTKSVGTGIFPSGVVQYAATYFNKYGQQSNIFYTSPLFYISGDNRGLSPEESYGTSFRINIKNIDTNFDHIRVYSILRTSEEGTPVVKIVGDIDITNYSDLSKGIEVESIQFTSPTGSFSYKEMGGDQTSLPLGPSYFNVRAGEYITFYRSLYSAETGQVDSVRVGSDELLFLKTDNHNSILTITGQASGTKFIVSADSDGVSVTDTNTGVSIDPTELLYVGGEDIIAGAITYKDNTLFLGNLKLNTSVIPDSIKFASRGFQMSYKDKELPVQDDGSATGYAYKSSLSWSLDDITTFMGSEYYRIGVRFQHESGRFSEIVYIRDWYMNYRPEITSSGGIVSISCKMPYITIPVNVQKELRALGYVRAQGVVVFPDQNTRRVVCQGILQPTVFNLGNRISGGSPYAQAGWKMRFLKNDPLPYDIIYPSADTHGNVGYLGEIQSDIWYVEPIVNKDKADNLRNLNTNKYFIDNTILTLESPDITFDDRVQALDLSNTQLRVVGIATFTAAVPDYIITLSKAAYRPTGGFRKVPPKESSYLNGIATPFVNWPMYVDKFSVGTNSSAFEDDDALFPLYMWHRAGSLNNSKGLDNDSQGFGILNKKIFTQLFYSNKVTYMEAPLRNLRTSDIKLFNSNEVTAVRLSRETGDIITYYGNIDTMVPPPPYHPYVMGEYGFEWDNDSNYKVPGYFLTYVVRTGLNYSSDSAGHGPIVDDDFHSFERRIIGSSKVPSDSYQNRSDDSLQHVKITDGIRMTYKTSPHIVVTLGITESLSSSLQKDMQVVLPSWNKGEKFYSTGNMESLSPDETDGWVNNISLKEIVPDTSSVSVVMAELYRPGTPDFGGYDEAALQANRWLTAGPTVYMDGEGSVNVEYTRGDTFVQRYDHLRTYPFTSDDLNQNIEIASFLCMTRVNIDGRYDRNRGLPVNMSTTPSIFNLYNPVYSQKDDYFLPSYLSSDLLKTDYFPSTITWSRTKTYGEDIDTWSSVSMTSVLDMDGGLGPVRALKFYNNDILSFQDNGIAKVLFNSRVQVGTSDQVPIEIANSGKVDGKVYLSRHIGTVNKFSITETNMGLYFMDNNSTSIYLYNGQFNDLSDHLGFKSWCANNIMPDEYDKPLTEVFTSHYDKANGDIYFNNKDWSLCYSQLLGQFMSFYSYNGVPHMFNISGDFYSVDASGNAGLWKQHSGLPCHFYGSYKPFYTHIIACPDMIYDKVFDTLDFRADSFTQEGNLTEDTFDTLECWNEYQRGTSSLTFEKGRPSTLKRLYRVWRANIPREDNNPLGRLRNTWLNIKLSKNKANEYSTVLHDLTLHYTL